MQLIFATHNPNKVDEIRQKLNGSFEILSLSEIGFKEEIAETGKTLEENALIKARYVFDKLKMPCFADDTGLEVEALNKAPGVYSARYAGSKADSEANMNKLLLEMKNKDKRQARFRTVIAYMDSEGKEYFFKGSVNGNISYHKRGVKGFGYDPVFVPEGYQYSFGELSQEEKNAISHRGRAMEEFANFLLSIKNNS